MKQNILYVFSGEKAQGAEIVIERLMYSNTENVHPHLFIAPGTFAAKLLQGNKPYKISLIDNLKKLNRSSGGAVGFYLKAVKNYCSISYKAYRYVKDNKISIVHANTIVPASYLIPCIFFSKILFRKTKFIWSDHDLTYYSRLDWWFSKICVLLYHKTLVVSKAVKRKYGNNNSVIVLYNGLDTGYFKRDMEAGLRFREKHGIPKNELVIGMAAVIVPRKGQLEMIQVFNQLASQFPHISLVLAGRYGEDHPGYNLQVKAAIDADKKIIHIGYVDGMPDFYNACNIIVSNTDIAGSEPLGTGIYEAMACESIVVASDTGGTPEIIIDKEDGFLFEADKPGKLFETLCSTLKSYNNLNPVKAAARKKVMQLFTVEKMKFQYNGIIDNLLQSKK